MHRLHLFAAILIAMIISSCSTPPPLSQRVSEAIGICAGGLTTDFSAKVAGSIERNTDKVSGGLTVGAINAVKSDFVDAVLASNLESGDKMKLISDFNDKRLPCLQKYFPPPGSIGAQNIVQLTGQCQELMTGKTGKSRTSTYSVNDIRSRAIKTSTGINIEMWGIAETFNTFGKERWDVAYRCEIENGAIVAHSPIDPKSLR